MNRHIVWHQGSVTRQEREQRGGHRGFVLWFTGLSGAGICRYLAADGKIPA